MNRFLIVSVNAIGDTYLSLIGARKIKDLFPNSKIDFVISPHSDFLFSNVNFINEIIIHNGLINSIVSILKINKMRYDYVFNFFPGRINTLLNISARARIKAGYWNFLKVKDWSCSDMRVNSNIKKSNFLVWKKDSSYLEKISLVLQTANINVSLSSKLIFPIKNIRSQNYGKYYLLHTSSRVNDRSLSNKHSKDLVEFLWKRFDQNILIIASVEDKNYRFIKSLESKNIKIINNPDLPLLIDLIISSRLFIAIDSFPIHIADAYDTPFLGIFGPTNPESVLVNSSKSVKFNIKSLLDVSSERFLNTIETKIMETIVI